MKSPTRCASRLLLQSFVDDMDEDMEDLPTLTAFDGEESERFPSEDRSAECSNTPTPSATSSAPRKRGRPSKKKKVDSDFEDAESSTSESIEFADGTSSDPDYDIEEKVTSRKPRSARKRGLQSYNEKQMTKQLEMDRLQQFISESAQKKRRGRPRKYDPEGDAAILAKHGVVVPTPAKRPLPPPNSLRGIMKRLEPQKEHEFLAQSALKAMIPWAPTRCKVPIESERMFVAQVESRIEITSASGGFRRFVKSIGDQLLLHMFECVRKAFIVTCDDDFIKLIQVMRLVWNMLDEETRLAWEFLARKEVRQKQREKMKSKARTDCVRGCAEETAHSVAKELDDDEETDENVVEQSTEKMEDENADGTNDTKSEPMETDKTNENMSEEAAEEQKTTTNETVKQHSEVHNGCDESAPYEELTQEAIDEMACMPHSEQSFIAGYIEKIRPDRVAFTCPICLEDPEEMFTFSEIVRHMMSCHFAGLHYGCHLCGRVFPTADTLSTHACGPFGKYMLERILISGGTAGALEMKCAWVYLACVECGLCLPLRSEFDVTGQVSQFRNQWLLFLRTLSMHNCDGIIPLIVYMPEKPDASLENIHIHFVPSMCTTGLPMACRLCNIDDFSSLMDIETHYRTVHSDKAYSCRICGEILGTEPFYKAHCLKHLPKSVVLADYLSTQCRYFPPAGDECSAPLLGLKAGSARWPKYPVGGVGKLSSCFTAEYVHPFEGTLYSKLLQTELVKKAQIQEKMKKKQEFGDDPDYESSDEEEEEENSEKGVAPDFGYEHVGRLWIEETKDEKSIRQRLAQHFKQTEEAHEFLVRSETRLVEDDDVLEALSIGEMGDVRLAQPIDLSVSTCELAVGWVTEFTQIVSIPLKGKMDNYDMSMVADFLLEDERVYYCHCGTICKGSETVAHVKQCFLVEGSSIDLDMCDKIHCIYSPFWPSDSRLHCFEDGCEDSACGVTALRAHLLSKHSILAPYASGPSKLAPLTVRAQSMFYRTKSARMADSAIGLKNDGLMTRRVGASITPLAQRTHAPLLTVGGGSRAAIGAPIMQAAVRPTLAASLLSISSRELRPFRISRQSVNPGDLLYECNVCSYRTENTRSCPQHLIEVHSHPCNACGLVFLKAQALTEHRKVCHQTVPLQNREMLRVRCPNCGFLDRIRYVVAHLIQAHYTKIRFDSAETMLKPLITGLVLPKVPEVGKMALGLIPSHVSGEIIEINEEETNQTRSSTPNGTSGVVYDMPRTPYECFLCEMNFVNEKQLRRHYEMHPERWEFCPVCKSFGKNVSIDSHEEFKRHIEEVHVKRNGSQKSCLHCFRPLLNRIHSHLIYECTTLRVCLICSEYTIFPNFDQLTRHRSSLHGRLGDGKTVRFECSLCRMRSYCRSLMREHQCITTFLPHRCACNNGEVFADRTQYEVHYRSHLRKLAGSSQTLVCDICGQHVPPGKGIGAHRALHQIVQRDISSRRCILLAKELLVEEETAEEKSEREAREAAEEEQRREREDAAIVREVLKTSMQKAIEVAGEEWAADLKNLFTVDDEDDECIVLESDVAPSLRTDALSQLPREESETSNGASATACAYFEDDEDDDQGDLSCVNSSTPEVRTIIDENGDDELAVVAEVAHPAGTLPSVIASGASSKRQRVQCPKCSAHFITKNALKYHLDTAHRFDAGGTLVEDYGIPVAQAVFLCRTCCVAFETSQQLNKHAKEHAATSQYNCDLCSMVAYNTQLLSLHQSAHGEGRLTFACHDCRVTYNTDSELCGHLEDKHSVLLLYFCKACNMGSTNGITVAEHIQARHCRPIDKMKSNDSLFGVVPASVVHYNPINPTLYVQRRDYGLVQVVEPSLCNHRTFVAPAQAMVACGDCRCLMNLSSFIAFEEARHNGKPIDVKYTLMSTPHATPQRKMLAFIMRKGTKGAAKTPQIVVRNTRTVPAPSFGYGSQLPILHLDNSTASQSVRMYSALSAGGVGTLANAILTKPGQRSIAVVNPVTASSESATNASATAQIVTRPLNMSTLAPRPATSTFKVGSAGTSGIAQVVPSTRQPKASVPKAASGVTDRDSATSRQNGTHEVISLSDDDDVIIDTTPSENTKARPPHSAKDGPKKNVTGSDCHVCGKRIPNENVLMLHELHTNGHSFFCLDCPMSLLDEQSAVEHYYQHHVLKAIKKKNDPSFRPLMVDVRCPFRACGFRSENVPALRQHLHQHSLPHKSSYCQMTFCTTEKCSGHESKHRMMEEAGVPESTCCVLCGTVDLWSRKLTDTDIQMTHMAIHGLRKYFMCRDCSVCFKHDADAKKFVRHFESEHTRPVGQPGHVECKLCKIVMHNTDMAEHAKIKHYVHGFKKRSSACEGQLVVKSGAQMRLMLGMDKIYYNDDGSDVD